MENPEQLKDALLADVAAASDLDLLEQLRVSALGRKGRITDLMKGLGALDPDERRATGQALNQVKEAVQSAIDARKAVLEDAALDARLVDEVVDVTLPVDIGGQGRLHPIGQTLDEVVAIFGEMGFSVAEGPDIEDDFHNFEALNIPPEHPARQMHDTFYLPEKSDASRMVLRTHTSPVQIRTMENEEPPIRIIAPGLTYRCDSDLTHTPMFHQVEGLVVDKTSHMGHLRSCLIEFCRAISKWTTCRSDSDQATPVHRTLGRGGYRLFARPGQHQDWCGRRLARDPRLRNGAPKCAKRRRYRSR